jgi:hypothetical protein
VKRRNGGWKEEGEGTGRNRGGGGTMTKTSPIGPGHATSFPKTSRTLVLLSLNIHHSRTQKTMLRTSYAFCSTHTDNTHPLDFGHIASVFNAGQTNYLYYFIGGSRTDTEMDRYYFNHVKCYVGFCTQGALKWI